MAHPELRSTTVTSKAFLSSEENQKHCRQASRGALSKHESKKTTTAPLPTTKKTVRFARGTRIRPRPVTASLPPSPPPRTKLSATPFLPPKTAMQIGNSLPTSNDDRFQADVGRDSTPLCYPRRTSLNEDKEYPSFISMHQKLH